MELFMYAVASVVSLLVGCHCGSVIPTTTVTPLKVYGVLVPMVISVIIGTIVYCFGWGTLALAPLSWAAFYTVCGVAVGASLVGVLAGYLYRRFR